MPISIISEAPEKALQSAVLQNDPVQGARHALHFFSSKLPRRLLEEEVLPLIRPGLEDTQAVIYFLHDGDIVIIWSGKESPFRENLRKKLYGKYSHLSAEKGMDSYYDLNTGSKDLLQLCSLKIESLSITLKPEKKHAAAEEDSAKSQALAEPTPDQLEAFKDALYMRSYREKPSVLVVEDQQFSRSLMMSVLGRTYTVHVAENASDAMNLFFENAPDIVFLDIELPSNSGHEVAALIGRFDPQAFIVMVTGSNLVEDINRARKNGVKGFIVKPYSKQKILDSIQRFIQEKKEQKGSAALKHK